MMVLFQNGVRVVCYLLVFIFIVMTIAVQTMPDASSFAISAKTEYFEGVVDKDGTTFSTKDARVCATDPAAEVSASCGRVLTEISPAFSGRISFPSDVLLRIRRGDGPFNQIYIEPRSEDSARIRMEPYDGSPTVFVRLPARIDLPSVGSGAPYMINLAGHGATIGAASTRDTSGLRNVLRGGEIVVYGIGLWWHLTGDPTAPVNPSHLFRVGAERLQLGDSISMSSIGRTDSEKVEFWANVGFDKDGVIEVSLRAVGEAAVIERFGGSGLLLKKSWLDTLIGDPLFQMLWSVFGTLIALAGIQFLGRRTAR